MANLKYLIRFILAAFVPASFVFLLQPPQFVVAQTNFDDEILYLAPGGVIKTLDLTQSGSVLIDWSSDEGDFFDFAIGDFTGDGDPEVAAIKGMGVDGRLVVYDPVVSPNTAIPDDRSNNRVPWKLLYERAIGFTPLIVGAGNLDDSSDEDEILIGFDIGGGKSEIQILKLEDLNELQGAGGIELSLGDGTSAQFDRTWNSVSIGQIDDIGPDEIVLTDSTIIPDFLQSTLAMYRVDKLQTNEPFFRRSNSFAEWRSTAIGEVNGNNSTDIVAMRKVFSGANIPTVFFFEYDAVQQTIRDNDDGCPDEPHIPQSCPDDVDSLLLVPRPSRVMLADVNNNDEFEMFFLRSSDIVNNVLPPRFFLINRGADQFNGIDGNIVDPYTLHRLRSRDIALPAGFDDNFWDTGTGGDFDGDGDDEIAIGRPNRISTYIFRDGDFPIIREDALNLDSDDLLMKAANLDRFGFATGVEVIAETSGLQSTITAGGTLSFNIVVRTFDQALLATLAMPNKPDWLDADQLDVNQSLSGQVPFTLTATIDATSLVPGPQSFTLEVTSSDPIVINSPSIKTVDFVVAPAQFEVEPTVVSHVLDRCELGEIKSFLPITHRVTVGGTGGINFGIQEFPADTPWLSIDKDEGTVPEELTITLEPSKIITPTMVFEAEVQLVPDARAGSGAGNVRVIPIQMLCAQSQIYHPIVQQ